MTATTTTAAGFDGKWNPVYVRSTKPSGHSLDGTIANTTTTSALTLGPQGEYEITIISTVIIDNPPHVIYIRDSTGSAFNSLIFGCPIGGCITRRFRTSEDALQITLRNNNSSGTVIYALLKVE